MVRLKHGLMCVSRILKHGIGDKYEDPDINPLTL